MKKFELNPKEELLLETNSNPVYEKARKARIDLYFIVFLVILGGFFFYVMQTIEAFSVLVIAAGLGIVICAGHYIVVLITAKKDEPEEKYYITNARVAVVDKEGVIKKEVLAGKIKKVIREPISGSKGTVFINKKIDSSRKATIKSNKTNQPVYSVDTIILRSIKDSDKALEHIEKISK